MTSIIPESQQTLAERLAAIGVLDGLLELGQTGAQIDENALEGLKISSEANQNPGRLGSLLTDSAHPAFGFSLDGISLGSTINSESFGVGNITVEPSIKKSGSVDTWVDLIRKCNLRAKKSVVLIDNGENQELIDQLVTKLDSADYLKVASGLDIRELLALNQKSSVCISSTAGGLLLALVSITPFLHVYSTMPEKQLIDDLALSSFGFGYKMLDKGEAPAVITAKLKDLIEDEIFLRKEIEKFREFMRGEFLRVLQAQLS